MQAGAVARNLPLWSLRLVKVRVDHREQAIRAVEILLRDDPKIFEADIVHEAVSHDVLRSQSQEQTRLSDRFREPRGPLGYRPFDLFLADVLTNNDDRRFIVSIAQFVDRILDGVEYGRTKTRLGYAFGEISDSNAGSKKANSSLGFAPHPSIVCGCAVSMHAFLGVIDAIETKH